MTEWPYIIAIIGGFVAGIINTFAGSGSVITLSILTEVLGLPGNIANGTNRVGILAQSIAGTITFYQNGKLNLRRSRYIIVTVVLGAILGIYVATQVSNEQFTQIYRYLMVLMLLVILAKPSRWLRDTDLTYQPQKWFWLPPLFALGFYAGFIQMGMGVFFLAIMVLGLRYQLMEANAVKIAVVGILTVIALAVFALNGQVHWRYGLLIATGQATGGFLAGYYGSKYPQANVWAYRLLVAVVILIIIRWGIELF